MGVFAGSARRLSYLPFSRSRSARSAAIHPLGLGENVEVKLINGPANGKIKIISRQADELKCNMLVGTKRETGDISHGIVACAVAMYEWNERIEDGRRLYFFDGDMSPNDGTQQRRYNP